MKSVALAALLAGLIAAPAAHAASGDWRVAVSLMINPARDNFHRNAKSAGFDPGKGGGHSNEETTG